LNNSIIPIERVQKTILFIRKTKVILDADLASLYGVSTKRLNEQIKRNQDRFPPDFFFQLTKKEKDEVVANCDHLENLKFSPSLPNAFTEHGALMAASVLNAPRAIEISVLVVRAFVAMREMIAQNEELAEQLAAMEERVDFHDEALETILEQLRALMKPNLTVTKRIGFKPEAKETS
jgi:hypothetical protein